MADPSPDPNTLEPETYAGHYSGGPQNGSRLALLFFAGLTLFYLGLSPGSVLSQGYMTENLLAAREMVYWLKCVLLLRPTPPVDLPRHGIFEPLLEVPFLVLGRLFLGESFEAADRSVSAQTVVATSLICTLIFLWVRRITSSKAWAYTLAIVAGVTTMLWPYAYIGMETTQSLFLMLAGFIALASRHKPTWWRAMGFALSCGLAVGLKANGTFLIPAVAFLIVVYFRRSGFPGRSLYPSRSNWLKLSAVVFLVAAIYLLAAHTRSLSPVWVGGQVAPYRAWIVPPLAFALNCLSLFASINKGLLIYCPVILLCLLSVKKAFRQDPLTTVFAGLTLGGLVAGSALVFFWSEETWGPRYLHTTVAPMILCLALARHQVRLRFRKEAALVVLAGWGVMVSFLGVFFEYDTLHTIAIKSSPSNIEQLQYDINWNPLRFHFKLLKIWIRGHNATGEDDQWPPQYHIWAGDPDRQIPVAPISLREYAIPQPFLLSHWRNWGTRLDLFMWWVYLISFASGPLLLVRIGYKCFRMAPPKTGHPRPLAMKSKLPDSTE